MRATLPRDWGNIARETRRDAGLTQAEVAKRAGVSRRWLVDFENGASTEHLDLVLKLIATLDLMPLLEPRPPSRIAAIVEAHRDPDRVMFP